MTPYFTNSTRLPQSHRLAITFFLTLLFGITGTSNLFARDFAIDGSKSLTWEKSATKTVYIERLAPGHLVIGVSIHGSSLFSTPHTFVEFSDSTHDTLHTVSVSFNTTSADTAYGWLVFHDSTTTDSVRLMGYDTTYRISTTADYRVSHDWPIIEVGASTGYTVGHLFNLQNQSVSVSASLIGDSGWSLDTAGSTSSTILLDSVHDRSEGHLVRVYYHPTGVYLDTAKLVLAATSPYAQRDTIRLIARDSNFSASSDRDYLLSHDVAQITSATSATHVLIYNRQAHPITLSAHLAGDSLWSFDSLGSQSTTVLLDSTHDRTSGHALIIYYHHNGHGLDTARLYLSCTSPLVQADTVLLNSTDNAPHDTISQYHLHVVASPSFTNLAIGDTACGVITITNFNAVPLTITHTLRSASSNWSWDSTGHVTPFVIAAHDSVTFPVCFHNVECGSHTTFGFVVYFIDSTGRSAASDLTISETGIPCVEASMDTVHLTSIIGGYAEASVTYTNNDPLHDTVKFGGHFDSTQTWSIVTNPFPEYLPAGNSATATFRFTPITHETYTSTFFAYTSTSASVHPTVLIGRGIAESETSLNLFDADAELIALRSQSASVTRTYYLRNNSANSVRVTAISLLNGTHFAITGISPHAAPDTLAAGDTLAVTLQFDADSIGYYHDSLIVTLDHSVQSLAIDIQAVREASAAVPTVMPLTTAELSVNPNPANGPISVAIDGARSSNIEIYDLLGHRLATETNVNRFVWNPADLSQGVFIVRAFGIDASGEPFSLAKRVVLEH